MSEHVTLDDSPLFHRQDGSLTTSHERQLIRRKQSQQELVVAKQLADRLPKEENPFRKIIDDAGRHTPTSRKGRQITRWEDASQKWEAARKVQQDKQAEQDRLANDPAVQAAVATATEWMVSSDDDVTREGAAYRLGLASAGQLDEFWRLQAEVTDEAAANQKQAAMESKTRHDEAAEAHYLTEVQSSAEQLAALEARNNAERFSDQE
ncbi:MAG: hypothetical protein HQ567_15500 [Candidatus Nealsonbacteria bacterium]|nr:hypothetical protein [Candidatus Nealsonbacteria bacterium]